MPPTLTLWIVVCLGGALGTGARYGVGLISKQLAPAWPLATLLVNVIGGFAIGFVAGLAQSRPAFPESWRLALTTGVLGGFTTFSAFSLETLLLWREGQWLVGAGNIVANVVLSLAACAAGYALGRSL